MEKTYGIWEMDENGKVRKGERLITSDIFAKAAAQVKAKKVEAENDLGLSM